MEDRTWTVTWGKESDLIASLRENEQFIRKGGKQKKSRGMEWGGRREEGSGWGTHVYLWQIHFDIWQN